MKLNKIITGVIFFVFIINIIVPSIVLAVENNIEDKVQENENNEIKSEKYIDSNETENETNQDSIKQENKIDDEKRVIEDTTEKVKVI